MSSFMRSTVAAIALCVGLSMAALAQAPVLQGFATPDAAAEALTDAIRKHDDKAIAAILGRSWNDFIPGSDQHDEEIRERFLKAWDEGHKIIPDGPDKALVGAGTTGWVSPIPIVRQGNEWRYDVEAGRVEMQAREIGRNELAVIQTLLAIVDAQRDYAALEPMKVGVPVYARRLVSSPGRMDGLYWETKPGEPQSPLGPAVARAQVDARSPDGHYGYYFRLLYAQGPAAPGGARDYIVGGRMIGGFGAIAWPVRYGVTGIMTFIVGYDGVVYQRDLGPDTAQKAGLITVFNPDKNWDKANMAPP